jgi:hypothetical protein
VLRFCCRCRLIRLLLSAVLLQVHTAVANAECVRTHSGIWAVLTRPPLPANLAARRAVLPQLKRA